MNVPAPPANAVAAASHPNPYPYYAQLVAEAPFHYDRDLGAWIAADAEHVEAVLQHPAAQVRPPSDAIGAELLAHLARFNNGDRHLALRARLDQQLKTYSERALGEVPLDAADGDLDAFIQRYPIYAVAAALGIGASELPAVFQCVSGGWNDAARLVEDFGLPPTDVGLLFQTYDATRGLIGNTVLAVSRGQYALDQVQRPDGLSSTIEKTIRDDSPVQNTRRYLAKDARIAGTQVRESDCILVLLAAANRDPVATRAYTFGLGPHACPGRQIAISITEGALRHLFEGRLDTTSLARSVTYLPSPNARIPLFKRALQNNVKDSGRSRTRP